MNLTNSLDVHQFDVKKFLFSPTLLLHPSPRHVKV